MIFIQKLKCKIFDHPTFFHFVTLGLLTILYFQVKKSMFVLAKNGTGFPQISSFQIPIGICNLFSQNSKVSYLNLTLKNPLQQG